MPATSVGEIGLDLVVNSNEFKKQMSGITGLAKKAGAALAGAFAVKKLVDFGKGCMELGSDLAEVQNVVDVTFPAMSAKVDEFAKSAASSFGLSETMAKKYTGTFGAMAKAFGFSESAAYDMGSTLTGLAGDVASFYNISQDEAYTKLKSVFTGETESLKDLGVVMTQSALDAYAMANGFGKTTQAMSEAEKVALRYQFVQSKLATASGDFARTSDGWANQIRILNLQFDSLKATIGQGLINVFLPIIQVINKVIRGLSTLANAFKSFTELITGNKSSSSTVSPISELGNAAGEASDGLAGAAGTAGDLSDATKGVGSAAKKAAKEMRALMGFDKISRLDRQDTSSADSADSGNSVSGNGIAAGVSLGQAVDFGSLAKGDTIIDKTNQQLQSLIDRGKELANLFKSGFEIGFGDSENKIQSIKGSLSGIGTAALNIVANPQITQSAGRLADEIAKAFGKITGSVIRIGLTIPENLFGGLNKYLQQNGGYIKSKIVSIFDASAQVAALAGKFCVAVADIFDVFGSPEAQQCTADIIGIFADGFLGAKDLGLQFIADVANLIVTPITDNVEKIKLAFAGLLIPISIVLGVLHTSIQNTFQTIGKMYEYHIRPMVDSFVSGISSIASTFLDAWNTYISPVLTQLAEKFESVWNEHVQPLIDNAVELIGKIADLIKALWENIIQPIIEEFINTSLPVLGEALSNIGDWVLELVGTISDVADGILTALGGVIDFFTGVFTQDWDKTTQGLKAIADGLKKSISAVFNFIKTHVLQPFDKFLTGVFETDWTESFGVFGTVLNTFFSGFKEVWDGVKSALEGIIKFVDDVFSGKWGEAWQACVDAFDKVFGGLVNILKMPVNGVIALLNGLIGTVNNLLEAIEDKLKFDFTIPNPFGGNLVDYHWQATLPRINWSIPELAQGGYVKPNTPQLAMIGDNRHQGEVVAPEDKLQAMVDDAVRRAGSASVITKDDLESIINRAVMRIVSALASVGFNIDGEQLATLQRIAQTSVDRRFNTVEIS